MINATHYNVSLSSHFFPCSLLLYLFIAFPPFNYFLCSVSVPFLACVLPLHRSIQCNSVSCLNTISFNNFHLLTLASCYSFPKFLCFLFINSINCTLCFFFFFLFSFLFFFFFSFFSFSFHSILLLPLFPKLITRWYYPLLLLHSSLYLNFLLP